MYTNTCRIEIFLRMSILTKYLYTASLAVTKVSVKIALAGRRQWQTRNTQLQQIFSCTQRRRTPHYTTASLSILENSMRRQRYIICTSGRESRQVIVRVKSTYGFGLASKHMRQPQSATHSSFSKLACGDRWLDPLGMFAVPKQIEKATFQKCSAIWRANKSIFFP